MFAYLLLFLSVSFVYGDNLEYSTYVDLPEFDYDVFAVKEDVVEMLKKLVRILKAAYVKGSEYLEKVLEDPDVKAILEHLNPLARRMAQNIIDYFKKLAKKIDEVTKEDDETFMIREKIKEKLRKLIQMLKNAYEKGSAELEKVLNDPDVKQILESLDHLTRKIVDTIIEKLRELAKKVDEATKKEESYGIKESVGDSLKRLIQILKNASLKGLEELNRVLNDPDVKSILEGMNNLTRRIAESIIEKFRELAHKIDEATKETEVSEYDLGGDSRELLQHLISILKKAFDKGKDYFYKVLEDPDVKGILDHLGPLTRRIAESIISKMKDLLEKIDNSTDKEEALEQYGLEENLLIKLLKMAKAAFMKGYDALVAFINDPDVKVILDHLSNLNRRIATTVIGRMLEVAKRIDDATKE